MTAVTTTARRRRDSDETVGFARSLGSAVGFVRKLVAPRPTSKRKKRRRPVDSVAEVVRSTFEVGRRKADGSPGLQRQRRELRDEVERLENELERIHGTILSGAEDPGSSERLAGLITRTRELRDEIHRRRHDLARVERHLAREERLREARRDSDSGSADVEPETSRSRARSSPKRARPSDRLRNKALRALDRMVFVDRTERLTFDRIADDMVSESVDVRRRAAAKLAEIGGEVAFDLLMVQLEDDDVGVRAAALGALLAFDDARAVGAFQSFLHDRDPRLRLAALRGLGSLQTGLPTGELISAIEDADAGVRKTAAGLMGWRSAEDVLRSLLLAVRDEDAYVRGAAADSLATLGDHRGVLSLIRLVADPEEHVRATAMDGLRAVLGDDVEAAAKGESAAERVAALKAWWREARVDKAIARMGNIDALGAFARSAAEIADAVVVDEIGGLQDDEQFESPFDGDPGLDSGLDAEPDQAPAAAAEEPVPADDGVVIGGDASEDDALGDAFSGDTGLGLDEEEGEGEGGGAGEGGDDYEDIF